MYNALTLDRLHFGFTATFHYLFPQLSMGLALLIVVLKSLALWKKQESYNLAARFWAKIFGITFVVGVVTGIPMEFQFGTNWAAFSRLVGGVIGQTLAMEGVFAFFLESVFLGLFLFGEKRLSRWGHWWAAFLVFLGAWVSGYFIIVTNAWMQHPVAYSVARDGSVHLSSFWDLLLNPWALWQYAHNMGGAVVTGSFAVAALGAFYLLSKKHIEQAKNYVTLGVITGLLFSLWQLFPTGDQQAKMVARHQPLTLAAMESLFQTQQGAGLVIIGQPNMTELKLDNPIVIPKLLSFLAYGRFDAEVKGLSAFPREKWPDLIPLLFYSYHIMIGLGMAFIAMLLVAAYLIWRRRLFESRWMLWILMLSFPLPYIANTAGWMTAELGRQPWVVYGLIQTEQGISPGVSAGNALFSLLGFAGMYLTLGLLYVFLILREVNRGPESA